MDRQDPDGGSVLVAPLTREAGFDTPLASDHALRRQLADAGAGLIRDRYAQATFELLYMEAFTRAFGA